MNNTSDRMNIVACTIILDGWMSDLNQKNQLQTKKVERSKYLLIVQLFKFEYYFLSSIANS